MIIYNDWDEYADMGDYGDDDGYADYDDYAYYAEYDAHDETEGGGARQWRAGPHTLDGQWRAVGGPGAPSPSVAHRRARAKPSWRPRSGRPRRSS